MADFYIKQAITGCKCEEELDALMDIFNGVGSDVNLTTLALETRAQKVCENSMTNSYPGVMKCMR